MIRGRGYCSPFKCALGNTQSNSDTGRREGNYMKTIQGKGHRFSFKRGCKAIPARVDQGATKADEDDSG